VSILDMIGVSIKAIKKHNDIDPLALLYKEGEEVLDGLTYKIGNLIVNKNNYVNLPEGITPYIETSFGKLNITDNPIWVTLLVVPYLNYLFRKLESEEDLYHFFNEEDSGLWFE